MRAQHLQEPSPRTSERVHVRRALKENKMDGWQYPELEEEEDMSWVIKDNPTATYLNGLNGQGGAV